MSVQKSKLSALIATLTARIAADTAKLNEVTVQLEQFDAIAAVGVDSVVLFKVGRAETRRQVQGVVLAVKTETVAAKHDEEGNQTAEAYDVRSFKVQYGEDFDAQLAVITESQIEGVVAAE